MHTWTKQVLHSLVCSNNDFYWGQDRENVAWIIKGSKKPEKKKQATNHVHKQWILPSSKRTAHYIGFQQDKGLSSKDIATIKHEKWSTYKGRIVNENGKYVVPKRGIHDTLIKAHSSTAHNAREKTEWYDTDSYAEASKDVITLFFSHFKLITSRTEK